MQEIRRRGRVRSCVRLFDAVRMTAAPDAVRGREAIQVNALCHARAPWRSRILHLDEVPEGVDAKTAVLHMQNNRPGASVRRPLKDSDFHGGHAADLATALHPLGTWSGVRAQQARPDRIDMKPAARVVRHVFKPHLHDR